MVSTKAIGAVEAFLQESLIAPDPVLERALARSADAGLPAIAVSPTLGAFLHILARATGARRILELGTLGGYSTIWLGRALPADGRLVSLEFDARHAAVARENLEDAGLSDRVTVTIGPALDSLDAMIAAGEAPFDFVFIDADKPNNPHYLERCLKLSRSGTVIVCDNVVRGGAVADARSDDPSVQGSRRILGLMGETPGLTSSALQILDGKGYDGFAIALVG